jgi:hypothetical protein
MGDSISRPWWIADLYRGGRRRYVGDFAAGSRHGGPLAEGDFGSTQRPRSVRAQIYLSGTYVRDFLLSPYPDTAKAQAAHLATLERETQTALDAYRRELAPNERGPFLALRNEINANWRVLDATVQWSPQERNRLRFSFFYNEPVPRRTAMLQVADGMASVKERGLTRSEEQSADSAEGLHRYLIWTFAGTLSGGLILALLTIGSTLRLERELDLRRADLQELSTLLLRA